MSLECVDPKFFGFCVVLRLEVRHFCSNVSWAIATQKTPGLSGLFFEDSINDYSPRTRCYSCRQPPPLKEPPVSSKLLVPSALPNVTNLGDANRNTSPLDIFVSGNVVMSSAAIGSYADS